MDEARRSATPKPVRAGSPARVGPGSAATNQELVVATTLLLLLTWASSAMSQHPPLPASVGSSIKVDVDLVQFPVSVTDSKGRPFTGLRAENFRILDNGIEQKIHHFSTEDLPYTMGLVLDRSGSMAMIIRDVYDAAFHTIQASKPEDEFFIAVFNDQHDLLQDFSANRPLLERQLRRATAHGQTALYDAIFAALRHVEQGTFAKKALLVVTDGADNASRLPFDDLLKYARFQEKVTIYVVGLFEMGYFFLWSRQSSDEKRAMRLLTELAEASGGKAYFPRGMDECKQVCIAIAQELRQQYSLGYYPEPRARDGAWHAVEVRLQLPSGSKEAQLTARARAGYLAPRE